MEIELSALLLESDDVGGGTRVGVRVEGHDLQHAFEFVIGHGGTSPDVVPEVKVV